jgi:hypothetical protein
VFDYKQIQISGPKVGSVTLTSAGSAASVAVGGTLKFNAVAAGRGVNQGIAFSVGSVSGGTGPVAAGTSIGADGTLTVAAGEAANSLFVRAVSETDATKFDTKQVLVVAVTGVSVTANGGAARVARGERLQFTAAVTGRNNPAATVTWKVSTTADGNGAVTSGTTVASDGTLTVAAGEAAATVYVIAVSTIDTTKSGSLAVVIPTVTGITISPASASVRRGEGQTFRGTVQGTGDPGREVTWKVEGVGGTAASAITTNGILTVSAAETLSSLVITASSVANPEKTATAMVTIPAVPAAVPVTPPVTAYVITGSGASFSAARGGAAVGTAGQPVQDVITAIRTHAAGGPCAIQFGNGATALDIGTASVSFNNDGGTWGAIALSGKLTGSITGMFTYVLRVNGNISINSTADIINTSVSDGGGVIIFYSPGTLTISGGTVQGNGGIAIQNDSTGTVTISGGTVTTTYNFTAFTINNRTTGTINVTGGTVLSTGSMTTTLSNMDAGGTVNISGGTVESRTSVAISNPTGRVNVSGTAVITSANTGATSGTINSVKPYSADNTNVRLEITGGTVRNTSTTTGNAIYNGSTGEIRITGGTVSKAGSSGYSVYNASTGKVTVTSPAVIAGARYPQ